MRQLQRDLNKIYAKRGIEIADDGDFGMGTYALVRRFQRARGYFLRNGVVGKWTKSAIARAVKAASTPASA
nr:peptidoglycan-binding protein [Promicromonospora kroppenstedtii]